MDAAQPTHVSVLAPPEDADTAQQASGGEDGLFAGRVS